MAYRRMASFYANLGNRERSAWAAERAFRYRAKLPDPMQRVVEGTYYTNSTDFDLDKTIAAYEAEIELFGREATTFNNLGLAYRTKRDFDRALATWREAVSFDTTAIFASTNILTALWATNRKDETRSRIATTLARQFPGNPAVILSRANLASAEFKVDSAERILEEGLRDQAQASRTRRAALYVALTAVQRTRGRVLPAQRSSMQAASLDEAGDTAARVPWSTLHRAKVLIWDRAKPEDGRRLLDSVVSAHPSTGVTALGYPWTDLATTYAQAGDVATARRLVSTYEKLANANTKTRDKQDLELARGWIAVAEKRYADAIIAFRAADVYSCTICALPPLAHAYDLTGQADSSIAVFERYLATNYFLRRDVDQTYLAGTYKRLGELYEAKGNDEKAREYYSRFIDLWRDADAELQPRVSEGRQRLAALRAKERR
jgi:tetratricopeptide (TPR) repeat protein